MPVKRIIVWSKQLVVRVYLFSFCLIIVSMLVFFLIGRYYGQTPFQRLASYIVSTISEDWEQPQIMHERAMQVQVKETHNITFYDSKNNLILTTVEAPLPPLSPKELQRLKEEGSFIYDEPPPKFAVSVVRDGKTVGYGLIYIKPPVPFLVFVFNIIFVIVLITIFSILFARSLAIPIRHLSKTAHAFGEGDFTVRARMGRRDELGDLAKTFDVMADRVNNLMRSQKELLANVSHELRTPLSRIRVALDIAAEGGLGLNEKQWTDIIHDLEELELLLEDVLMAARLDLDTERHDKSELPLSFEKMDTRSFLDDIATQFRDTYSTHKLELHINGKLLPIIADPRLFRCVINNLINNARKYSDPGSLITIEAHDDGHKLHVEITDQGIGIREKDVENVFKSFFRTDQSRTRSTGGVGLGLTLTRRIIETHGGTINLQSTLGKGTVVRFSMPHVPVSKKPETQPSR